MVTVETNKVMLVFSTTWKRSLDDFVQDHQV